MHYSAKRSKIFNAFGARKGCRLVDYDRPRTVSEEDFSDFTEALHDITVKIPSVVEASDKLIQSVRNQKSEMSFMEICSQWQESTYEVNHWYAKMHTYFGVLYEEYDSASEDSELEFGPSYRLPSYWISQAMMHYWAARLLLYDALAQAVSWAFKHDSPLPVLHLSSMPIPVSDF